MKKHILPLLIAAVLCFNLAVPSNAAAALDVTAEASLTLRYEQSGTVFGDLPVRLYRVAEARADGTFALVEPFDTYPLNIHGIQTQDGWQTVAETLHAYLVADGVAPTRESVTDQRGIAQLNGLQTGLYFVWEATAETNDGTYRFNQFLVYLPTPSTDGSYNYHVEAKPKCTQFVPATHYTVTKLWQDDGHEADRPTDVTVDIYKDGILYETQRLGSDNRWSYTWSVSADDHASWTVAERAVAAPYTVTVQKSGNVFTLINTRPTAPTAPPETGESVHALPWILLACSLGMLLLMLGLYGRRRK